MFTYLNRFLELIPLGTSLLFIVISSVDDGPFFHFLYTPILSVICVFYWFFSTRGLIGTLTIFLIGIFSDIMLLNPIGTDAFALLIAYYFTREQRELCTRYGFFAFWMFFGYFSLIFFLIRTILLSMYFFSINFDSTTIAQYLFTFFLYPVVHYVLSYLRLKKIIFIKF